MGTSQVCRDQISYRVFMPALAGGLLVVASLLPWLNDPLGEQFCAWQLPVDIGWQWRSKIVSYGLLCCCEALFAFWITAQSLRTAYAKKSTGDERERRFLAKDCIFFGILYFVLPLLFIVQYIYIDMGSIAKLANHEMQMQLIKAKLGYGSAPQFLPIQTLLFDPLTQRGRVTLLLDQIGSGSFLALAGAWILLVSRWSFPQLQRAPSTRTQLARLWRMSFFLLLLVLLVRAPAALICNYQAQILLSQGNYAQALSWLNRAEKLNPSLDQLSSYHIERGHAWYFLHPREPTSDSQVYLAAFYRQQNDYLASYQELLAARQRAPAASWVLDEFAVTLERLAEMSHPLSGAPRLRVQHEESALKWLDQLTQIEPRNVYAHYLIGRIQYDLQNYSGCEKQMLTLLHVNQKNEIVSAAYTYLALSRIGQGDPVTARNYLFKAEELDPAYRNNTAREEASGLR